MGSIFDRLVKSKTPIISDFKTTNDSIEKATLSEKHTCDNANVRDEMSGGLVLNLPTMK